MAALVIGISSISGQDSLDVRVEEKIKRRTFLIMLVNIVMASHFTQFFSWTVFFLTV